MDAPLEPDAVEGECLRDSEIERITVSLETLSGLMKGPFEFAAVEKAIRCDPSGITAALFLSATASELAKSSTMSIERVLAMSDEDRVFLGKIADVRAVTQEPGIDSAISAFQDRLREASDHYGVREKVDATLVSRDELAYIRSSAFRTFERLRVHQFAQGQGDDSGFKYNQWIHEFNNVNSMIRIVGNQPESGITLALIRDEEIPEYSYFGFVIRNGQTVTFLTESLDFDNPDQKYMRRNPGRDFERRLNEGAYFPYELIGNIETDHQGHLYVKRDPEEGRLVTYQTEAIRLARLEDMAPEEIVWMLLMFDLIRKKFWEQNHHVMELSYTAEMLEYPLALHAAAQSLAVENYQKLEVPRLKGSDIDTESVAELFEIKQTRFNKWMEDRYGDQVNEGAYHVLSVENSRGLLLGTTPEGKTLDCSSHSEKCIDAFWVKGSDRNLYKLSHLKPTEYGTKAEVVRTYKFVARKNRATAIQALADEEFARERENVLKWFRDACTRNLNFLKDSIVSGECIAPVHNRFSGFKIGGDGFVDGDILLLTTIDELRSGLTLWKIAGEQLVLGSENLDVKLNSLKCVERRGIRASSAALFRPREAKGIARLAGCAVTELPIFLQHWCDEVPYYGNSILSNVDPLESNLRSPWINDRRGRTGRQMGEPLQLHVVVPFSKTAIKRWRE